MTTATRQRRKHFLSLPIRTWSAPDDAVGRTAAQPLGWRTVGLLVVVTLLLVNVTLVVGVYSGHWDAADFFCPFQMLLADCARQGQFLLWTPLLNAGYPAGLDPQVGAFSPLTVGVGLLTGGREFGFRVYWLLIWALGGVGIVILARHFAAPPWAAYVAAVGFMFCGTYTGHAEHTCFLEAMSLFPWVLWRWDAALLRRSLPAAAQAGALWGLSALAGYPGMVIVGGFYLGLWTVGRLLSGAGQCDPPLGATAGLSGSAGSTVGQTNRGARRLGLNRRLVFAVAGGATFLVVAMAVMAPTYAGFLVDGRGYSVRTGPLPREVATRNNALHPQAMATFASPYLAAIKLVNPDGSLYPGSDVSTCSIYLSPLLFVLAAVALWHSRRERFRWYLAALGVLCLLCAMGGALPLRGWLYDLLLPMRYFRHAGIFRCYYLLTVVVLALLASRNLQDAVGCRASGAWRAFAVACWPATVVAGVAFVLICVSVPSVGGVWNLILAAVHFAVVWLGVTVAARVGRRGDGTIRSQVLQRHLVRLAIADAVLTAIISKPTMYANRGRLWDIAEARHMTSLNLGGLDRVLSSGFEARNANLQMKTPVLRGYSPLSNELFTQSVANPILAASALGPDRVWFSRQAARLPFADESFQRLVGRTQELGRLCLAVSDPLEIAGQAPGDCEPIEAAPPAEPVPVTLVKYQPNELILDAVCPTAGWLMVTDRWTPAWRATVNGRAEPIAMGNFLFRTVRVEKGVNHLCFSYHPFGHPWLLMGSWSMMGLVFGGAMFVRRSHCSAEFPAREE
jgi:hypothetical protein